MAKAKPVGDVTRFLESIKPKQRSKWDALTGEQQQFIRDVYKELAATGATVSESSLCRGLAARFGISFSRASLTNIWAMLDGESK